MATLITGAASSSRLAVGELGTLIGLLACGMANVELGRLAEGGRVEHQRIHKGLSAWPLAAALLLGPGLAGWVAGAVYLHAGVRGIRIRRWKWAGSWAIVTLASTAASSALEAVSGGQLRATGSPEAFVGVVASIGAFLAVETVLLWVISRLNTPADEVYLRAQLASAGFYLVELSVLCSGALAAVLFRYWPGFILLGGPVSLLIQRGMLHAPLKDEARHDPKTGLLNCEAWRKAAARALALAGREGKYAVLVVVDVDHFKAVNDTFGHVAVTAGPDQVDFDALLAVADEALYASKTAGRDHVSALEAA